MKIGDYVRTDTRGIWQLDHIIERPRVKYKLRLKKHYDSCTGYIRVEEKRIIKSSPNIINLIEVHDVLKLFDKEYGLEYKAEVLLNEEGYKYISNYECSDLLNLEWELISGEHVKILSIVTKEQFESMEYKIGEQYESNRSIK